MESTHFISFKRNGFKYRSFKFSLNEKHKKNKSKSNHKPFIGKFLHTTSFACM